MPSQEHSRSLYHEPPRPYVCMQSSFLTDPFSQNKSSQNFLWKDRIEKFIKISEMCMFRNFLLDWTDCTNKNLPKTDSHKDTSYRDQGQGLLSPQSACIGASQSVVSMHRGFSGSKQHAWALELRFGSTPASTAACALFTLLPKLTNL